MQVLTYSPGQYVSLWLETKDTDGYYADADYNLYPLDGYNSPVVFRLIKPDLTLDGYYPQPLHKFDTGMYYYNFTLPVGAVSVGSYIADVMYRDPDSNMIKFNAFQILVSAPMGLYSISTR